MATSNFTKAGVKATTPVKLENKVFAVDVKNHQLLKEVYDANLSNARVLLATTKTRGLVRGGGKKPWRQKGTGRARFGSTRNPIWRGGGIVFGPSGHENYTKDINTSSKRVALIQSLSLANKAGKFIIIEAFSDTTKKTNDIAKLLKKIGASRKVLIVTEAKNQVLVTASNNLSDVKVVSVNYLNVNHVLDADQIVLTKAALDILNAKGGDK